MDLELRRKWLNQQKELFGNSLYIESKINHDDSNIDLDLSTHKIKNCQKCSLGSSETNFVFGIGNPDADFVFIGEDLGKKEDLTGNPFIGESGKLLDKIMLAINLTQQNTYILNVLKCKTYNDIKLKSADVKQYKPYIKELIQFINPKLIIFLGEIIAQTVLNIKIPLNEIREKSYKYEGIDVLSTYHPAELLMNPKLKRPTWEDFKKIKSNYILELTS
ncbi:MAG: uracil-DNA glycosylase [Candidatus Marinimicrobia bacterium]|nr:uracil-DNA glycosylase [Candidatus Neomarinimicrobiota bacterium]|tara:strand:- start:968 stop:1624 length:657 start_codon:yes stop_codon:yes gene_type:complete